MIIDNNEQGSQEWLDMRVGKISGTRIVSIITPAKLQLSKSKDDLILKLIDENITGLSSESSFKSEAMERGNELEQIAKFRYIKETGIKIIDCGFCYSKENNLHGLSPDGFTLDYVGGTEFKCPGFRHLKYIDNDKYKNVTIYNDYKPQCINYFIVNKKMQWLDTISFRPEFYPKPMHIERIFRQDIQEDITKVQVAINQFFKEYEIEFNKYTF